VVSKVYNSRDIEPIPETQEEIHKQADAALRDLFPRIPNTDRVMILEHAFMIVSEKMAFPLLLLIVPGQEISWEANGGPTT